MTAKKRSGNKSSNYLLSCLERDDSRASEGFVGKLRSNFVGTIFDVFDTGANPDQAGKVSMLEIRKQLACVYYVILPEAHSRHGIGQQLYEGEATS